MRWRSAFNCLLLCIFSIVSASDDYYEILGVAKDADDRTIRKAFKKLAIAKHPDKNPGDKEAHAGFLKINRAYEVLKDEEMRKRYDQYGEKGLADDFNPNQNFQSWQFYNDNFGIYDEDVEITTLNRADFQRIVTDSNEIWFINFYSTYCSHCHQLAPAWRKFAAEMEGVIRVGAVNCAEDPGLCQSQNVMGYPSLVWYPEGIFYQGHRDAELLIEFVMQRLPDMVFHVTADNYLRLSLEETTSAKKPWIIDFCDDTDRCLTPVNRRKLATMVNGLVNVGTVNCQYGNEKDGLCEILDRTEGVMWYEAGKISKGAEKVLESLDPKELSASALSSLDSLEETDEDEVNGLFDEHIGAMVDTVVWFVKDHSTVEENKEMVRLLAAFPEMKVNYFDCYKSSICDTHLDVAKLPTTVLFKQSGGYEINYVSAKPGWRDQVAFVREAVKSPLRVLSPYLHDEAVNSGEMWLIDYFAPWCPPCIRLMSELRRLHSMLEDGSVKVNVGTVDCTRHNDVCKKAGVGSYPHKNLYYNGKTFSSVGYSSVDEVIDFIEDSIHPSVHILNPDTFSSLIDNRADGITWVVDFFAPWCGPCQQLAPEFQRAARHLREFDADNVKYGSVDCQAHRAFCEQQRVAGYPTIRLFPARGDKIKRKLGAQVDYPGNMWKNADSISRWTIGLLPSLVTQMGNEFWTEVLDSPDMWLVDFYAPWCGPCMRFSPIFDQIAKALEGRVNLAKVDCDQWPGICQGVQIRGYPTVRLYKGAKGRRQSFDGIGIQSQEKETILKVVENFMDKHQRDEL